MKKFLLILALLYGLNTFAGSDSEVLGELIPAETEPTPTKVLPEKTTPTEDKVVAEAAQIGLPVDTKEAQVGLPLKVNFADGEKEIKEISLDQNHVFFEIDPKLIDQILNKGIKLLLADGKILRTPIQSSILSSKSEDGYFVGIPGLNLLASEKLVRDFFTNSTERDHLYDKNVKKSYQDLITSFILKNTIQQTFAPIFKIKATGNVPLKLEMLSINPFGFANIPVDIKISPEQETKDSAEITVELIDFVKNLEAIVVKSVPRNLNLFAENTLCKKWTVKLSGKDFVLLNYKTKSGKPKLEVVRHSEDGRPMISEVIDANPFEIE